jgi:Protein of unknown function (DUF3455)
MKRLIRPDRILLAACVAALAAWPLAQAAIAGPAEPTVPNEIQVLEGNKVFLVGHAVGVQIYSCNATATGYGWSLVAPRANLYDDNGKLLAIHYGGPTWQAKDGSYVVGQVEKRVTVDPTAIAWLRLAAASKGAGPYGDRLAATTYIQRIATTEGLPPAAAGCSPETAGTIEEIPYTADYYFWKATGD